MGEVKITIQMEGVVNTLIGSPCVFKTGSKGYRANGKIVTPEGRYQVNIMIIRIGSKPKGEKQEEQK